MTIRRAVSLTLMFTLLGAAGCAERTNVLSRLIVQPETANELGYGIDWVTNLSLSRGEKIIYAELLGDRLVTFETGGVISVVNAGTGEILWRDEIGTPTERFSKPVHYEDKVVICSETRAYIYDINFGDLLKIFPLAYVSNSTPTIVGGLLIHGSPTGVVFAQDLEQGLLRWNYQMGTSIAASPKIAGPTLIVATNGGHVAGFNPYNGSLIWRSRTWDNITTEPATNDVLVFAASTDQSLYAFERSGGEQRWRYYSQDILGTPPRLLGDYVMQWVPSEKLICLNALTGEKRWSHDWPDFHPLQLHKDMMYMHRPGNVTMLDPRDGEVLKVVPVKAVDHIIAESPDGGPLYMIRVSGPIMKLTPQ